mgnify:CR=1 FL=1
MKYCGKHTTNLEFCLKDKEGTIREVDALLEISEGECTEKLLTIVSSLAEGNKE